MLLSISAICANPGLSARAALRSQNEEDLIETSAIEANPLTFDERYMVHRDLILDSFEYNDDRQLRNVNPEFVSGEILVKFKSTISVIRVNDAATTHINSINELNRRFEVVEMELVLSNLYRLTFLKDTDVFSVAREYEADPNVEYAEPNYLSHACVVPNDVNYTLQWAHKVMQSELAWNIEKGSPDVVIAIIDTGVDWNHPDLAANIWNNTDEIIDRKDNDGNGYVDDVRGYDFVDTTASVWPGEDGRTRDNDPMDFHGHGTHCAGIAAAVTNNGIGIAGMSWNCKIMPVRAGYKGADGGGWLEGDDVIPAIRYAADNGADIISMSYVGYYPSEAEKEAYDYAYSKGCVLVAAAGNDGSRQKRSYPAVFDNVIAVGATDLYNGYDVRAYFSNYGSWIDISAPGVDIYSTLFDDTYISWQGTSMSTPFVAGLAGLILSKNPNFTNEEVRNVLRSTTDPVASWEYIGLGRINAYKALQRDSIPIANLNSSLDDATIRGIVKISGTASGKNFKSYVLYWGEGVYPTEWTQIGSKQYVPVENGVLATWDTSLVETNYGMYSIRLLVYDVNNQTSEDRAVFWISQLPSPGYYETSEYFIGSVAVGIVFLESNGTIDPQTENWTSTEESQVISEIKAGLSWWTGQNPLGNMSFAYDIHYRVPTSYEPINRNTTDQGLWISEAMTYLGYTGYVGYKYRWLLQAVDYVNDLRYKLGTDWAFAIFVVDSSNDADGCFEDKWCAYAYLGGPFQVMTYDNNDWGIDRMDRVCAHETGHIFFATDEYNDWIEWSGYLNEHDIEGSGCLMDENNLRLSDGTKLQIGWRDSDGDGILDIVDTFPEVSLKPYLPDPTSKTTLQYSGSASVSPYPNQNPLYFGRAVTINKIAKVQFRVDSGNWTDANATDGAFGGPVENYTFTTPELSFGNHTIEVRAINSVGNIAYAQDTVTVIEALPPVASFSYYPPYKKKPTTFNASASHDPDGTIISYIWDFGDGNVTTTTNPIVIHVYANVGNYTVILNVTDSQSLWNTATATVTVKLMGDLNDDCVVNILDVSIAARAYGTRPGDKYWNPIADVERDGVINILDISKVAKEYGQTCQA